MTEERTPDPEQKPEPGETPDPEKTERFERDWSRFEGRDAAREARRAAHDAAREADRAAREAEREARRAEHEARRAERSARREEWRGRRIHVHGSELGGVGFAFDAGDFAKRFMKDFVSDATGESYSETISGEFTFERMPRLRVRNISGETKVRVGDAGKITVVAKKHVTASSEDRAKRLMQNLEIRMEKNGDELRIEPHLYEQERGWVDLFRGKRFRVDFELTVPKECAIDAQTVSGDLWVSGTRGPLEIQGVSGDMTVEDVEGPLRLKSVSGDVSCRRYVGHLEGNTVSGDATFDTVRLRSTQLHTVSGDVEIKGVLEAARAHRFRTISGDIDLSLADPDLLIEYKTASGDLESEVPARVTKQDRKHYTVALGDARGQGVVKTVSGDLTIRGTNIEVPGEPSTEEPTRAAYEEDYGPEPEAEPEERDVERTQGQGPLFSEREMNEQTREEIKSVLEKLAKGELGVDDAAAALDAKRRGR